MPAMCPGGVRKKRRPVTGSTDLCHHQEGAILRSGVDPRDLALRPGRLPATRMPYPDPS